MENTNQSGLEAFWRKVQPVFEKIGDFFCSFGHIFKVAWSIIVRLRKIIMAAPVILVALRLARVTMESLDGAFRFYIMDIVKSIEEADLVIRQVEITQEWAVIGPLAVTGACLVLMFLSRRTVYPWLISIFSLVLPIFIVLTSALPA